MRSGTEPGDFNVATMTTVLRPNRRRIPPPHFNPIEEHTRPTRLRFTQELHPQGGERQLRGDLDPITFPPQDAVQAIGNALTTLGYADAFRRGAIGAVGMGKDVGGLVEKATVSAVYDHGDGQIGWSGRRRCDRVVLTTGWLLPAVIRAYRFIRRRTGRPGLIAQIPPP